MVEGRERTEVQGWLDEVGHNLTPRERQMIRCRYDASTPLPDGADTRLATSHPRLVALRDAYERVDLPVTVPSIWNNQLLGRELDLRYFRGESPFVFNYREWPRAMTLKYFVFLEYVRAKDSAGLLERLGEDGAFGCWTFEYPGYPRVSRDLLDSVNEILFLDRHLGLLDRGSLRVLDIGAGYGRLAHRMIQAADVGDYCCVDAVPESTFISEYYLEHRGCMPPARVVPLPDIGDAIALGGFDLAVNIHSFTECTYAAVAWWLDWLEQLRVPNLLIVPNDREELLAYESDWSRRDFGPLVEAAGYELVASEPVFDDLAVQELLRVPNQFLLFRRALRSPTG
jgi:SAM-dependent methyltransferase